jgi:hypothetical protein
MPNLLLASCRRESRSRINRPDPRLPESGPAVPFGCPLAPRSPVNGKKIREFDVESTVESKPVQAVMERLLYRAKYHQIQRLEDMGSMPGKYERDNLIQVAGLEEFGTLVGSTPVEGKVPSPGIRLGVWKKNLT